MPDQLKTALLDAGLRIAPDRDLVPYIDYLYTRCSVGKKKITSYLETATDLGTPIIYTDLYIICRQYESQEDPERSTAKALRVAVSDVRRLRRRWGVRKPKLQYEV